MVSIQCFICTKKISKYLFKKHLKKIHPEFSEKEYYDIFLKKEKEDICECGCGQNNKFIGIYHGYNRFSSKKCASKYTNLYYSWRKATSLYWKNKGLTEEEARIEISKLCDYSSIEYYVKRFGEVEGKKRFGEVNEKKSKNSSCRLEYYIKEGYSEEEAEQALKERQQTFTLEKCIEKYGEAEGKKKYKEVNKKKAATLAKYIAKYGEIEGKKKYKEYVKRKTKKLIYNCGSCSNISQELFKFLDIHDNIFFYSKNYEYYFYKNNKILKYDFTDLSSKKIIEFNGDYWHVNPLIYEAEDI